MRFIPQYEPCVTLNQAVDVFVQVKSGWVGPGKACVEFEERICDLSEAKYCVATTSGTTALIMAIQSLDLPKGSTIGFPAYTFLAGANAAKFLGYNVELIDIREETLCMNPKKIDFTKLSALIFVNHNAYVGEDIKITKMLCDTYKIPMIEDSSQALGMPGAGLTGDIGVFSFSVPKIVTTGQGGAIVTNNFDLARKCKQIRDHGDCWRNSRVHDNLGVNFKFNDILASYGNSQLKDLDNLLQKRKKVFDLYREHIKIIDHGYESAWMALYKSKKSDTIIRQLTDNNIQSVKYYKPISWNQPYETDVAFPVAEKIYDQLVYLPSSLNLTKKEIKRICKIILEVEND